MSISNVEKVKNIYDSLADTWDSKSKLIKQIRGGESNRSLVLLNSLIKPDMKIADIGAGTGRATRDILKNSQEVQISAVDLSPKMLAILRKLVANEYPDDDRFITKVGDVETIVLPDSGNFDLVVMLYLLHHVENAKETLLHASIMIKDNGRSYTENPDCFISRA
ncbi:methyltransferase domain-containing protein [Leuconostoc gelidum subsp. gasicomitatum]|uniref:class I SAM-dependent methyltransferase n=1 Tax=Leuconostoc gasicomitatum TaxID=115778 RepID=UPI001CC4B29A|nr:class I SAM-dependent methyltransferase [Leuconostoc gasicomitatum]MBZ5994921.1 methyltransferase domain-containing protein [Leuconostoc gasicomitatum]